MKNQSRPQVLILTQPLGYNYGGILQAYALQRIVRGLGSDVQTNIAPGHHQLRVQTIQASVHARLDPLRGQKARAETEMNAHLYHFIEENISTTRLFSRNRRASSTSLHVYSTFIVGSDQVWRPLYSNVSTCLFDFLPSSNPSKRLSYAASFGTDSGSEYSALMRARTRRLARRLDAVSVRESSGIELVRELWGRPDAEVHVDPTLLLPRHDYDELIANADQLNGPPSSRGLVTYFLDATPQKKSIAERLANKLGASIHELIPSPPNSMAEYERSPDLFRKPPVEAWLASIRDAQCVLTDSFHGAVFSILFHKPFVVLENRTRGVARLKSLLSTFVLEHRMFSDQIETVSSDELPKRIAAPIDWSGVDKILASERVRAVDYLARNIA